MIKLKEELLRVLDIKYKDNLAYKQHIIQLINRDSDMTIHMATKLLSENESLTVEVFDKIKSNYENKELVIRDDNGKIIREMKIFFTDNHYDWDKNDKQDLPPKMRWNGKDKIHDWQVGCIKKGDFTIINNEIIVIGNKDGIHNSFKFRIKDGYIDIGHTKLKYFIPISFKYESDAEECIIKFRNRVSKMDIMAKQLILDMIDNSVIIKEKR